MMESKRTRTKYHPAIKKVCIAEVLDAGKSLKQVSTEYGVNQDTLGAWVRKEERKREQFPTQEQTANQVAREAEQQEPYEEQHKIDAAIGKLFQEITSLQEKVNATTPANKEAPNYKKLLSRLAFWRRLQA